jgi:hypothetical protein
MTTHPTHDLHPKPEPHVEAEAEDNLPPVRRLPAVPGFMRWSVLPLIEFAAALSFVAAVGRHWRSLVYVIAVLPIALVIQWAITTHQAALRGAPIHPIAAWAAVVVMVLVTLAMAALVVTAVTHHAALDSLDVLLRGGAR